MESPAQCGWDCTLAGMSQDSGEILFAVNLLCKKAALLTLDGQVFNSAVVGRLLASKGFLLYLGLLLLYLGP